MSNTLYFLNGDNLNKNPFTVSIDDTRSAPGQSNTTLQIARGNGVRVSENSLDPKIITVKGVVDTNANETSIRESIEELDKILLKRSKQTLRLVTHYNELITTSSATDWTASGDANSLALSTAKFNSGTNSIGFDITQSTNTATLAYSSTTQTSLGNFSKENVELSLFVPDVQYLESIDIRVGNDASNYYSNEFTTDYRNSSFENGWILLSVPLSSMLETGTVADSAIDYFVLNLNFNSNAENISGCYLDSILEVDENTTRNFGVYRNGEVDRIGANYMTDFDYYTVDFLCEEGVAKATHSVSLFTETGISSTSTLIAFDLGGSIPTSPEFTLTANTSTDIQTIQIKNSAGSRDGLKIDASNISDGDVYRFNNQKGALKNGEVTPLEVGGKEYPLWDIGKNRVQLIVESENPTLIPLSIVSYDKDFNYFVGGEITTYISQSFETTTADTLTSFQIYCEEFDEQDSSGGRSFNWYLMNDDGSGKPGNTVIASGTSDNYTVNANPEDSFYNITGLTISSLTTSTTYHLVFRSVGLIETFPGSGSFGIYDKDFYGNGSDSSYTGGDVHFGTDTTRTFDPTAVTTWTKQTGDLRFQITQSPTPSWDLDFSASYKNNYGA